MRPERGILRYRGLHAVPVIAVLEAKTMPGFVTRYAAAIRKGRYVEPGVVVANHVTLAFVRAICRVAGGQSNRVRRAFPMPGVPAIGRVVLVPDNRVGRRLLGGVIKGIHDGWVVVVGARPILLVLNIRCERVIPEIVIAIVRHVPGSTSCAPGGTEPIRSSDRWGNRGLREK